MYYDHLETRLCATGRLLNESRLKFAIDEADENEFLFPTSTNDQHSEEEEEEAEQEVEEEVIYEWNEDYNEQEDDANF